MAILLIVGVFLAHDGANWLAEGTRFTPAAVFYMLQGTWSALLSGCLLLILAAAVPSVWRSIAIAALSVSVVEGLMIPACRLAVWDIKAVPRGTNLCDYATGLPIGSVALCLEVLAICWIVGSVARA